MNKGKRRLAFGAGLFVLGGLALGAQPDREERADGRNATTPATTPKVYSPIEFGARPDGASLATEAIQRAIDECAGKGGGIVQLSPGVYLSGTIFMRTGVTLQIDEGATLLGSTRLADYPDVTPSFQSLTTSKTLDGESLVPLLRQSGGLKREAIFWHFPGYLDGPVPRGRDPVFRTRPVTTMNKGGYKLHLYHEEWLLDGGRERLPANRTVELYDLRRDVGEQHDLAASDPARRDALLGELLAWLRATQAKLATDRK